MSSISAISDTTRHEHIHRVGNWATSDKGSGRSELFSVTAGSSGETSNVPEQVEDHKLIPMLAWWGLPKTKGHCSLGTFFRYTSKPGFVLCVGGWDEDALMNQNDYLTVYVQSDTTHEEVRDACIEWTNRLAGKGKGGLEQGRADLKQMKALSDWQAIKSFMEHQ
jgi:hypothetical protein